MATNPSRPLRLLQGFGPQVLAAMLAGLALGLLARNLGVDAGPGHALSEALSTVGSLFVQLLRALVPPLVFTAIVASIANLARLENAASLVWRTLFWFALTALCAVLIGIVLGLVLQPGASASISAAGVEAPSARGGWTDFLKGLVPSNFLGLSASTSLKPEGASTSLSINVLQIVVISLVVGIAALRCGEAAAPFLAFNASLLAVVRKILWWVIRLTPVGTIGLLGAAVAQYGWTTLSQLGAFTLAVYLGLGLVMFGVYPALLALHGLNPLRFFAAVWPATQLGFVSRSSIGTLPVTETVTETRLGVARGYAAFAVPLGATTKMDGCAAVYPAVAAIFVAQYFHVPLSFADYGLIVFVSVVGSAATAGLTGAVVMLTLTLSTLGLPLEGVGLLLAIDPILDMGRTALNVTGQALVPTLVAKEQGLLDLDVYNGHAAAAPDPARPI